MLGRALGTLEHLSKYNYHTAKAYYHFYLKRLDRRFNKSPLLIYQMGKVGSSSVTASLRAANVDRRIYHVHFLTPSLVDDYERRRRDYLGSSREGRLKHIWQYQHINQQLRHSVNGNKWKIITLVRDPVARNLSTFFENIESVSIEQDQVWHLKSYEYDFEMTIKKDNLNALIERFFETDLHDVPIEYFDHEFKDYLGIDLFATEFPTETGYKIYQEKRADVLLMRLESLNECFTDAIQGFLGYDNLQLVNTNVGNQKDYADLYRAFKDIIQLPESYLDKLYSSKFAQHFYNSTELAQFKEKWSRPFQG